MSWKERLEIIYYLLEVSRHTEGTLGAGLFAFFKLTASSGHWKVQVSYESDH
jgi:hypothetical protein